MPKGKYFFIESKFNGLVLDVEGAGESPGTKVMTWEKGDESKTHQLWWCDHFTSTIRTKLNNFCLDIDGESGALVINPFKYGEAQQQWLIHGDTIINKNDRELVLDIAEEKSDPGAKIIAWKYHGKANQEWTFDHIDCSAGDYFFLESELNGKVLDVKAGEEGAGAEVIMWNKKDETADTQDNQLWYEDKHGNLCSKLNDFFLDASSGEFRTDNNGALQERRYWIVAENRIASYHNLNEVMDIAACCEDDGAKLIPYDYNGGSNQHWKLAYI